MQVTLLWSNATHEIVGKNLALLLKSYGFNCKSVNITSIDQIDLTELTSSDIIIISAGGKLLNQVINRIESTGKNPGVISTFPGIVTKNQVESMLTRLRADVVFLNSRLDLKRYKLICKAMNVRNNGIHFCPLWSISSDSYKYTNKKRHIFAAQNNMLSMPDKLRLASGLIEVAKRHPEEIIEIKAHPKDLINEFFIFLQSQGSPKNIVNGEYGNINPKEIKSVITVSSSFALLALNIDIPVFILKDFKHQKYSSHFFDGSGLKVSLSELNLHKPRIPNKKWMYINVHSDNSFSFTEIFECLQHRPIKVKLDIIRIIKLILFTDNYFWKSPKDFFRKISISRPYAFDLFNKR